ncbi:MAG: DUF2442 domain-containing protein [Alphaproteobacteria bacterium]|nr:DUF2442 domain-containing protein [Thalassospira sp.]MCE2964204.1 DUF2442 domain-containing protein [Alphaproteobacteria bacterium]
MPEQSNAPQYYSPGVVLPPVVVTSPWRVDQVAPLPDYRFRVRFRDGLTGDVDMFRLVHSPDAGVFASLKDPQLFASMFVALGVVTWPNGVDLAPDTMHAQIKQHGQWFVE